MLALSECVGIIARNVHAIAVILLIDCVCDCMQVYWIFGLVSAPGQSYQPVQEGQDIGDHTPCSSTIVRGLNPEYLIGSLAVCMYAWRYHTIPPNLNLPILFNTLFGPTKI